MDAVGKPGWYRAFFARRSLRILPLYYCFLLLYWFLIPHWQWAAKRLTVPHGWIGIGYWVYLANMQNVTLASASGVRALGPLWSLSVEEQVYLLLPMLIAICPFRRLGEMFVALFGCSVFWKLTMAAAKAGIEMRYFWTPPCLDAFAAGGLVAWMSRDAYWRTQLKTMGAKCLLGSGMLALGIALGGGGFRFWDNPLLLLSVGTVALAVLFASFIAVVVSTPASSSLNLWLSARWLCWCGKFSYAAYIFHACVIELLRPLFGAWTEEKGFASRNASVAFTVSVLFVTFAVARISWAVFEKHFIALKRFFPATSNVVRVPDCEAAKTASTTVAVSA